MHCPITPNSWRIVLSVLALGLSVIAQDPPGGPEGFGPPGGMGRPGMGGPGGPGGPMGQDRKLVATFDKDGDGKLNAEERKAARESIKSERTQRGGRRGFGPPGGFGADEPEAKPGPKVAVSDVKPVAASVSLYDESALRTIFLDFENPEWEAELGDFIHTDVDVPATLTVDGKKYPNVGVHFRGASSLFMVSAGHKRSLDVSLDHGDPKQRLLGYKSLNLLNAHEDASFLHTVLYSHIARQYLPAPKANFVRVVINGESWGVYTSAQQFDRTFIAENFAGQKGARWKVPGSPRGAGGLDYVGEKVEDYKARYEIKSDDHPKAWKDLIRLCKVLTETPLDKLEEALTPIFDIDGALKFLALEVVCVNGDGYWVRASDYSIFEGADGKFHILPHDMNEVFTSGGGFGPPGGMGGMRPPPGMGPGDDGAPAPGGTPPGGEGMQPPRPSDGGQPQRGEGGRRGMGRGPGGAGGVTLDPLVGAKDAGKPLRSRLLAVPALRERYLRYVRDIASTWLDWKTLGPVVAKYRELIDAEVKADTRKLSTYEAFVAAVADAPPAEPKGEARAGARRMTASLRVFADKRREFLLNHAEIKKLGQPATQTPNNPERETRPDRLR